MELKNREIMELNNGLTKLKELRITNEATSWAIARICKSLRDDVDTISERLDALVKQYVEHTDKGKPKVEDINQMTGMGSYVFKTLADREGYTNARKELMQQKVEITLLTVKEKDLTGAEIIPAIREAILPIIQNEEKK